MRLPDSEKLANWLSRLENRYSTEIQLGLDRIKSVATKLDLLSFNSKVITVAGTNGKGSTVALLESIYIQAGYKVASYTSPHLEYFNERIKINLQTISDRLLITAFELIEQARGDIALTYFEMTTLAAFWCFKQQPLDLIILEVGLGGRLDATNIIDADLAIITTIAHDHEVFLGSTLEEIGFEKAGILKPSSTFIYADYQPPNSILSIVRKLNLKKYLLGKDYFADAMFRYKDQSIEVPKTSFHPNSVAAAVMATIDLEECLPVKAIDRYEGIKKTRLLGRLQQIQTDKCLVLLDVAHNVQAATSLSAYLQDNYTNIKIHAVFSAFADKDIEGMLVALRDRVTYWYPSILPAKRAADSTQLANAMKTCKIYSELCYNNPALAYASAYHRVLPNELIVVFGSFITVSCVLSFLSQSHIKEIQ